MLVCPRRYAWHLRIWPDRSKRWTRAWRASTTRLSPRCGRAKPDAGSLAFLASDQLQRVHCLRWCPTSRVGSARHFATWLGLAPRQNSSGGWVESANKSLSAHTADSGRSKRVAVHVQEHGSFGVARSLPGASAVQGCGGSARPQDGAHRLALMVKGGAYRPAVPAATESFCFDRVVGH